MAEKIKFSDVREYLTLLQRDVVMLRMHTSLTYRDIGEVLGLSEAATRQLYRRAIKRARREYGVSD